MWELGVAFKAMRKATVPQADTFPIDHRPWGFFETLILGGRFQVKRIVVNPGKVPMELIEVQTGSYLGEDDIIRYEDVYARGQGVKGAARSCRAAAMDQGAGAPGGGGPRLRPRLCGPRIGWIDGEA